MQCYTCQQVNDVNQCVNSYRCVSDYQCTNIEQNVTTLIVYLFLPTTQRVGVI